MKPSISAVIGERIELRKVGKEFRGRCPFHEDRHPSLFVNDEKGVFLCRSCGARGDVFDFVMRLDGVSFNEAKKQLGAGDYRPKHRRNQMAAEIAAWANAQTAHANALLRDIGFHLYVVDKLKCEEDVDDASRAWDMLSDLADDLQTVKLVIELYANRAAIEHLLADAEPPAPPPPDYFPPLTAEYRERLRRIVRGDGS